MKVNRLSVGPILGATTGENARIWARGVLERTANGPRRCFGVVRIRPVTSSSYRQPLFFKMNPNFDITGVAVVDDLEPEREYEYQAGWFFSDQELEDLDPNMPLDWSDIDRHSFTTGSVDSSSARTIILGSCRYLLKLFGGLWFDDRGDKTFRSILKQIDDGHIVDMLIMVGDQIYADDMSFIAPDQTLDQYNERYRDVFSQPHIRQLMSKVPTYLTLDDHEIEDGWPAKASPRDWVLKYPAAIHALLTYQLSHSPLFEIAPNNRITGVPDKLWYTFHDGCCDFFVTDTRTERYLTADPEGREIVNEQQFSALQEWLTTNTNRAKCIVSSVAFFPDNRAGSEDAWGGFLKQRTELLDFIREQRVGRVVFLSGDLHASLSAEMVCPQDPEFKVLSVVSSPFFWPYPHPRPSSFQLSGQLRTLPPGGPYEVVNAGPVYATDNFTRITIDSEGVTAKFFTRKGELLSTKQHHWTS